MTSTSVSVLEPRRAGDGQVKYRVDNEKRVILGNFERRGWLRTDAESITHASCLRWG